jgi:hypothetical protein
MIRARLAPLFGALFAIVALAGCNDSALPPGGTYQAVQGVVVDAATNRPVADATVTVDTVLTTKTDQNGKFSFAQVPVGEIDFEVSAPAKNYKRYTGSAHLAPDKPLSLTVSLSH